MALVVHTVDCTVMKLLSIDFIDKIILNHKKLDSIGRKTCHRPKHIFYKSFMKNNYERSIKKMSLGGPNTYEDTHRRKAPLL